MLQMLMEVIGNWLSTYGHKYQTNCNPNLVRSSLGYQQINVLMSPGTGGPNHRTSYFRGL